MNPGDFAYESIAVAWPLDHSACKCLISNGTILTLISRYLRYSNRLGRYDLPNLFTTQRSDVRYRVCFLPAWSRLHPYQHRVGEQYQEEHIRHLKCDLISLKESLMREPKPETYRIGPKFRNGRCVELVKLFLQLERPLVPHVVVVHVILVLGIFRIRERYLQK